MSTSRNGDSFATRVLSRRKAHGLSQEKLAQRASISRETVRAIESGTNEPRVRTLVALARALECDPAELLPKGSFDQALWQAREFLAVS